MDEFSFKNFVASTVASKNPAPKNHEWDVSFEFDNHYEVASKEQTGPMATWLLIVTGYGKSSLVDLTDITQKHGIQSIWIASSNGSPSVQETSHSMIVDLRGKFERSFAP